MDFRDNPGGKSGYHSGLAKAPNIPRKARAGISDRSAVGRRSMVPIPAAIRPQPAAACRDNIFKISCRAAKMGIGRHFAPSSGTVVFPKMTALPRDTLRQRVRRSPKAHFRLSPSNRVASASSLWCDLLRISECRREGSTVLFLFHRSSGPAHSAAQSPVNSAECILDRIEHFDVI